MPRWPNRLLRQPVKIPAVAGILTISTTIKERGRLVGLVVGIQGLGLDARVHQLRSPDGSPLLVHEAPELAHTYATDATGGHMRGMRAYPVCEIGQVVTVEIEGVKSADLVFGPAELG